MKKEIPVQQGRTYEIAVKTLGTSGEGVGRVAEFTVFVPGALPKERVLVAVDEVKKTYARGRIVKILEESPERVAPLCPIYDSSDSADSFRCPSGRFDPGIGLF